MPTAVDMPTFSRAIACPPSLGSLSLLLLDWTSRPEPSSYPSSDARRMKLTNLDRLTSRTSVAGNPCGLSLALSQRCGLTCVSPHCSSLQPFRLPAWAGSCSYPHSREGLLPLGGESNDRGRFLLWVQELELSKFSQVRTRVHPVCPIASDVLASC